MNEHKYRLKYTLKTEPGEFKESDPREKQEGLTDALVLFSILYPEDGSYSQMSISFDGRKVTDGKTYDVNDNDMFKLWILLGADLARSGKLGIAKHLFVKEVWQAFCEKFLPAVAKKEKE